MGKYEPKTKKNAGSVAAFLNAIEDPERRKDAKVVAKIMKEVTGASPKMWGSSIVGYGEYHYLYPTGQEADWPRDGFSPRKQNLTIYIMPGFAKYEPLLKKLGPHKLGKSCLYIKRLSDIDLPTLKKIIKAGHEEMNKRYPVKGK